MSITCASIDEIKINGTNEAFGGYIYNLSVSISYNSSSEFEIDFVSESGTYDMNGPNEEGPLNSETPSILEIKGAKIPILLISYNISESPNGNLLSVRYKDLSIKYLDKMVVGLQGVHVTDDGESENPKIIAIGKKVRYTSSDEFGEIEEIDGNEAFSFSGDRSIYTSDQLFLGIQNKGIKVTTAFGNALQTSDGEFQVVKDYHGNLRSVLQSWGSDLGYIFFWNFLYENNDGTIGAIDAISIISAKEKNNEQGSPSDQAKAFSEVIKEAYDNYITSYNYGESIEDCYTKNGTLLTVKNSFGGPGGKDKDTFALWEIFKLRRFGFDPRGQRDLALVYRGDSSVPFTLRINGKPIAFPESEFRAAVAAASLGSEFFRSFVYYCVNCSIRNEKNQEYKDYYAGVREETATTTASFYDPNIFFDYSPTIAAYYRQFIYNPKYVGYFDRNLSYHTTNWGPFVSYFTDSSGTWLDPVDGGNFAIFAQETIQDLKNDEQAGRLIKSGGAVIVSHFSERKEGTFSDMGKDDLFIQLSLYARYNNRFYWRTSRRSSYEEKNYSGNTNFYGGSLSTEYTPVQEVASFVTGTGEPVQIEPFIKNGNLFRNVSQPASLPEDDEKNGIILYDGGSKIVLPAKIEESFFSNTLTQRDQGRGKYDSSSSSPRQDRIGDIRVVCSNLSNIYKLLSNANVKVTSSSEKTRIPYTKIGSNSEGETGNRVEIYKRLLNGEMNDIYVTENQLSLEEIGIEELAYSRGIRGTDLTLSDVIDKFAETEFHIQNDPTFFAEFSMSIIPTLDSSWFTNGLDSLSISYGPDGVNSSIRISTQRRASETLDMIRKNLARRATLSKHSEPSRSSVWHFPPKFRGRFRRV